MDKIFNYSLSDIKKHVKVKEGWGAYFVIDNFLNTSLFNKLCNQFNSLEDKRSIYTGIGGPRVWRRNQPQGNSFTVGGAGSKIGGFKKLFDKSEDWKNFIQKLYSDKCYEFIHNIFSDTNIYKQTVLSEDIKDGVIGCKLSSHTNNYGDIIHPDNTNKVLSYLLYLDPYQWDSNSSGGTDFWEVTDKIIPYDESPLSMDSELRKGKDSNKPHSLKLEEANKVNKFLSVDFKPNRFIGFIRTDKSYHSIPPRVLPKGVTRDCLQINVWNKNRLQ